MPLSATFSPGSPQAGCLCPASQHPPLEDRTQPVWRRLQERAGWHSAPGTTGFSDGLLEDLRLTNHLCDIPHPSLQKQHPLHMGWFLLDQPFKLLLWAAQGLFKTKNNWRVLSEGWFSKSTRCRPSNATQAASPAPASDWFSTQAASSQRFLGSAEARGLCPVSWWLFRAFDYHTWEWHPQKTSPWVPSALSSESKVDKNLHTRGILAC